MTRNQASAAAARKRSRFAIARALLFFFVFLGLEILIDNRHEIEFEPSSCEAVHADETPWLYEHIYPRLTEALLGHSTSDRVRIVYVPEDLLDVQQNVCRGRTHLAEIINVLRKQNPHPYAIVLDKFFSTQSCQHPEEKVGSDSLRGAVTAASEAGITVVAGEATGTRTEPGSGDKQDRTQDVCLLQKGDFRLFDDLCPDHYGLTKLNANREQVPLTWRVLDRSSPQKVLLLDSLALTTVRLVDPERVAEQHLQDVLHQSRQPYARIDFRFPCISSTSLVPSSPEVTQPANTDGSGEHRSDDPEQSGCQPTPNLLSDLERKVVIIGSQNSSDRWLVLGKRHWGYQLQANYIDALLSGGYLSAVPGTWLVALSVLFLLILEAVPVIGDYLHCERNMHVAPVLRRAGPWLAVWAPAFVLLVLAGCYGLGYLPPVSLVLGVLLTIVLRGLFLGMDYFGRQSTPDRKEQQS